MLSKPKAEKAVRKVFPDSKIKNIYRLKKGMINENYSIKIKHPDKELILRIYPTDGWKAKKEKYLYDLMARKIKIPVPEVYAIDISKKIVPKNYLLLSKVQGKELNIAYRKTKDVRLIKEAGSILAKMHSIKFSSFGWIVNTEIKPCFRSWPDFVFYDLGVKLNKLSRVAKIKKPFINKCLDYVENNRELLEVKSKPCLLHKDYHFSHILSDKKRITGIIDFEWAIAGHSELDLIKSIWWMFEKMPSIEKPFLKGYKRYGTISNKFAKRKRAYELILLTGLIGFSYQTKNKKWFDYNLKKAKSILGIK